MQTITIALPFIITGLAFLIVYLVERSKLKALNTIAKAQNVVAHRNDDMSVNAQMINFAFGRNILAEPFFNQLGIQPIDHIHSATTSDTYFSSSSGHSTLTGRSYRMPIKINGTDAFLAFTKVESDEKWLLNDSPADSYAVDGKLAIITDLQVQIDVTAAPSLTAADNMLTTLNEICESCRVRRVPPVDTKEKNLVDFHELVESGGYKKFRAVPRPATILPNDLLRASFSPASVTAGGKTQKFTMDLLLPFLVEMLQEGKNIVIGGRTGVGKTTLATNILYSLMKGKSDDFSVVRLSETAMKQMQEPDARNALLELANDAQIRFFYDEAQSAGDTTPLLELMDGAGKLPGSAVLAVIDTAHDIPPQLLRQGRADIYIELHPLELSQANQLKNIIMNSTSFDTDKYQKALTADNVSVDRSIPTPANTIALCDVWACARTTSEENLLEKLMKRANQPRPAKADINAIKV
ncbi:AAA family ATPase [Candidatus Dependentiae bacterium]|nr:MAG: AAA family ATPase [Candidatus Dependentiae bacterium]